MSVVLFGHELNGQEAQALFGLLSALAAVLLFICLVFGRRWLVVRKYRARRAFKLGTLRREGDPLAGPRGGDASTPLL